MAELPQQAASFGRRSPSRTQPWWTPAMTVQAMILAGIFVAYYWHVLRRLVNIWTHNGDWSHGFLIPLFSLYYLYLQRYRMPRGLQEQGFGPRLAGIGLLMLGFVVYVHCTMAKIEYPKSVSLVISIMGAVLLVCGWSWTRWSWFAVAFLLFALPLPQRLYVQLTMPLQIIAAHVSSAVLGMVIPGLELEVRNVAVDYFYHGKAGQINVEQACSGMKSLMSISALGVAMAFLSDRPLWQRLVMILSCAPIAIFCNMIRVTITGAFVVLGRDDLARGFWHTMLGLALFMVALFLYGGVGHVLNHLFLDHPAEDEEPRSHTATGGATE